MEKRKTKNKSWFIIGSLIILIGFGLIGYDYYSNKKIDNNEELAIEEFYNNDDIRYFPRVISFIHLKH